MTRGATDSFNRSAAGNYRGRSSAAEPAGQPGGQNHRDTEGGETGKKLFVSVVPLPCVCVSPSSRSVGFGGGSFATGFAVAFGQGESKRAGTRAAVAMCATDLIEVLDQGNFHRAVLSAILIGASVT